MEVELFYIKDADPALLDQERRRSIAAIARMVPFAEVEEVGSTAVEGVIGKCDLDILVRVRRNSFGKARALLDAGLERNPEQFSDEEFQGYRVASGLDVCVQLTVARCRHDSFTDFRDRLIEDRALRNAYNELKRTWNGRPMADYRQAKSQFIVAALARDPRV